jgi:hypothetical protein
MNAVDWRTHIMGELQRLGVQVEKLPSGVTRLTNEHGHLMTTDIRNLTTSDLKTFAGRNGWRH